MSQDPNALFDQAVLDMIEHSPTGVVPVTPSYQDALNRLYASHQVYANADHKGGHATARSLARLPSFLAGNLAALVAGEIGPEALEANSGIFDRYLASLPADRRQRAGAFRTKVVGRPVLHRAKHFGAEKVQAAHDLPHTLFLVPGAGPHPGLPGNYLYGSVLQLGDGSWAVQVHDSDDGAASVGAATMPQALAKLQEVLDSAPFNMNELGALGFKLG
jgi:hypothetical protein